jgi:ABC-type lipoprotein export system ATPase subunit
MDLNREQGLTSVIVTHNLELARALNRQITLVDGQAMTLEGN